MIVAQQRMVGVVSAASVTNLIDPGARQAGPGHEIHDAASVLHGGADGRVSLDFGLGQRHLGPGHRLGQLPEWALGRVQDLAALRRAIAVAITTPKTTTQAIHRAG